MVTHTHAAVSSPLSANQHAVWLIQRLAFSPHETSIIPTVWMDFVWIPAAIPLILLIRNSQYVHGSHADGNRGTIVSSHTRLTLCKMWLSSGLLLQLLRLLLHLNGLHFVSASSTCLSDTLAYGLFAQALLPPTKSPARIEFLLKHTQGRIPQKMKLTDSFEI